MARPEIEGSVVWISGAAVRSLGVDLVVPDTATVANLIVVTGWKQGAGAIASVNPQLDGAQTSLTQASAGPIGADKLHMNLAQFRNPTAGSRRVSVVPGTTATFESVFLLAFLCRNGGECGVGGVGFGFVSGGYPTSSPSMLTTDRYFSIYWAYGASDILPSALSDVLTETNLGYSLGALHMQTGIKTLAGAIQGYGPNAVGETANIAAKIVVPYVTS